MLAERAAALEAMRRGLLFMVNRQYAAAFLTWSGQMKALRREGEFGGKLAHALGHFINRKLFLVIFLLLLILN